MCRTDWTWLILVFVSCKSICFWTKICAKNCFRIFVASDHELRHLMTDTHLPPPPPYSQKLLKIISCLLCYHGVGNMNMLCLMLNNIFVLVIVCFWEYVSQCDKCCREKEGIMTQVNELYWCASPLLPRSVVRHRLAPRHLKLVQHQNILDLISRPAVTTIN